MAVLTLAEQRSLPPDIMTDNQQESESYWRHEQNYLDDVVRQMSKRCEDRERHPDHPGTRTTGTGRRDLGTKGELETGSKFGFDPVKLQAQPTGSAKASAKRPKTLALEDCQQLAAGSWRERRLRVARFAGNGCQVIALSGQSTGEHCPPLGLYGGPR